MSTDLHRLERRGAQRFEVHLPLTVHFEGKTASGFTQDLSGRGIYLYAEMRLPEGASLELTFSMPSEITLAESMPVRCRGRVLRASAPQEGARNGVAVQLVSYQYLPADEVVSHFPRVSAACAEGASSGPSSR